MTVDDTQRIVGVGPHPKPWPIGREYDVELLENGDRRNVEDRYRYWTVAAIKDDMSRRSNGLHIAIENWQHDSNIGTIVRSANAFNVSTVHIIGKRHWNRRGAMVTDKYMDIRQHATIEDFLAATDGMERVAIDNVDGAQDIAKAQLPKVCVLIFGGEGPGVSQQMLAECSRTVMIPQFGSTRSLNIGVAAGIVMYQWLQQHIAIK